MRILFTICGRAGSKGIKNKNIRKFLGVPLPLYTLAAIDLYLRRYTENEVNIALNTDSTELIDILCRNQMCVVNVVKRKQELANDTVPKKAVIADTYQEMKKQNNCEYDMVVDLDLTAPLRTVQDVCNLVRKKMETDCDVVFSVTDSRRNPYFNMVMKCDKGYTGVIKSNYTARQQAPEIYDMNASMYAYKPEFLVSDAGVLHGYCEIIKMYDTAILDLDHENDFELMQVIAKYIYEKYDEFNEIREHAMSLELMQKR